MKIPMDAQIHLNKFVPRSYQLPVLDALENKGYKRIMAIMPRRAGKDVMAFNLAVRQCLRKPCVIYYVFPTYSQGRKVIMDGMLNTGERFVDFIPKELVEGVNVQEMKIRFINGSLLQVVGSDNIDSLMGTNPTGIVFSEYALQDPRAYQFLRPILAANAGWALFITTPRGKNHAFELYQIALHNPSEWFAIKLTLDDTQHIPWREIERERAEGIMSEDLIQQEYFCSFSKGVEGSYYQKYIDKMRVENRIGDVPWDAGRAVHVSLDIGVADQTSLIFYQVYGNNIVRVIDCYENSKEGLEHYINVIRNKPYTYGKFIAPHDIRVKEWGSGQTRWDKAKSLGVTFTIAEKYSIMDGIEKVRSTLSIMYIDQVKCALLIRALENYRQEYDAKNGVYKSVPLHNFASHYADSMRYLCVSLPKVRDQSDGKTIDQRYAESALGEDAGLPYFFRHK